MRKRLLFASLTASLMAAVAMPLAAHAATMVNGCSFTQAGSAWTLDANCTSTAQINIPTGVTLDGAGHTISSPFTKVDETNNSAIGVLSDSVTIKNLIIDGTGGVKLHGINVYAATNVNINNVTVKNSARVGIVVNGSTVSLSNVVTSGNGWSGIDVDQGGGVVTPSVLNIVGHMTQTDLAQIYVDDTTKNVTVNDTLHQYITSHPGAQTNDRLYTLDTTPTAMPTLLSPANNSTIFTHNFAFTWTSVTDPSSPVTYDWAMSYSGIVGGLNNAFTAPAIVHSGLTSPMVNSPGTPDNVYFWQVRAVDAAGNVSLWTNPWKVTVHTSPSKENECKKNGWKLFTDPAFRNQGQCVSFVERLEEQKEHEKEHHENQSRHNDSEDHIVLSNHPRF